MKNIAFYNIYECLNTDNFMFENADAPIGDGLLRPMMELRKYAAKVDVSVATVDACNLAKVDAFVFIDMPDRLNSYLVCALSLHKPMYLVIAESKIIREESYNKERHTPFKKVFTYDDSLVDNKKYLKMSLPVVFPKTICKDISKKEKLCALVANNKKSDHPLELYSERIKAIRWFEKNHPEDFDLYGHGWDRPYYSSCKGKLKRKRPVLEKCRFSICYENATGIPGYITEKIFDCFFAGCVPVYWGANNITEHIPRECFIDKRRFPTYEELYHFMSFMGADEYMTYLRNIEAFLKSKKAYPFSSDCYVKTMLREIVFKE